MATYYVSVSGSNSNDGTGADNAHAWLTIEYALSQMGTGGHTINVGAGTYNMNDGTHTDYFAFTYGFSSEVVVQSGSGTAADVVIAGPGLANAYDFTITGNITNLTFRKVKFANTTTNSVLFGSFGTGATITNFKFDQVIFEMNIALNYIFVLNSYSGAMNGLYFTGCTITMLKDPGVGILVAGDNVTNVNFTGNTCTAQNGLIRLDGASNSHIDDNIVAVVGTGATGLVMTFGNATATPGLTGTGNTMSRNTVTPTSGASYTHLMGAGVGHTVTFEDNIIARGEIWIKMNSGCVIRRNTIATAGFIEVKGSTLFTVTNNSVEVTTGTGLVFLKADAPEKPTNGTVTGNTFAVTGNGKCYGLATANCGSGVIIDSNILIKGASGTMGDILEVTAATTLAAVRNAWAAYDIPTNDANSRDTAFQAVPWQILYKRSA